MLKPVRYVLLVLLALAVSGLIGAGAVSAASTRAEYVAQVDPICDAHVGPLGQALSAYNKNYKRWVHVATHGSLKAWLKQTKRLARSLNGFDSAHSSLTQEIAAVPPAAEVASTVASWLDLRRRAEAYDQAAITALRRLSIGKFYKAIDGANSADLAAGRSVAGLGFQVCGVID
jgi:hypothetical protein